MSCGVGRRCGSDLALLWLWCRPAWEPPYAMGAALKRQKTRCVCVCIYIHTYILIYIHTHIYSYIYTHIHIHIYIFIYIYTHTWILHVCACTHTLTVLWCFCDKHLAASAHRSQLWSLVSSFIKWILPGSSRCGSRQASMRMWVRSLALLSGLRIRCCPALRWRSQTQARIWCCYGCGEGQQLQLQFDTSPRNFHTLQVRP